MAPRDIGNISRYSGNSSQGVNKQVHWVDDGQGVEGRGRGCRAEEEVGERVEEEEEEHEKTFIGRQPVWLQSV